MTIFASTARSLILIYKRTFSPSLLSTCRFTPTCSDYALEAVERYGVLIGGALAAWRILRCNPFSRGGLDTVPMRLHHHQVRTHTCHIGQGKKMALPGQREDSAVARERSASSGTPESEARWGETAKSLATEPWN